LQCGKWPWRVIETFAKFLGRAPDTATGDDIRRFQAEQITQGTQPPKMNTQAFALRFSTWRRRASIASVITARSPTAHASTASRSHASCSA
jgi:hypothetical protein